MIVVGNILLASQTSCGKGWDFNLFVGARPCGAHALQTGRRIFVDLAAGNFRLVPGSVAIGHGSPRFFRRRTVSVSKAPVRRPARRQRVRAAGVFGEEEELAHSRAAAPRSSSQPSS